MRKEWIDRAKKLSLVVGVTTGLGVGIGFMTRNTASGYGGGCVQLVGPKNCAGPSSCSTCALTATAKNFALTPMQVKVCSSNKSTGSVSCTKTSNANPGMCYSTESCQVSSKTCGYIVDGTHTMRYKYKYNTGYKTVTARHKTYERLPAVGGGSCPQQ
jgi:hypothetical protein